MTKLTAQDFEHRCSDSECPSFGQRSPARGCLCHQSIEQMMLVRIEALIEFRRDVISVIPMAFLIANSPAGATGPSEATDVVQAIRDMTAAGRRLAAA